MKPARVIRPPAVAGLFYPGDPQSLADTVDALIANVPGPIVERPVRALVSPHAGYTYSGAAAAHAFRSVEPRDVATVVVVGPSHVEAFDFTSVYDGDAYATPLGLAPVDTDRAAAIAASGRTLRASPHGHRAPRGPRGEHGIEVLLPFVQRLLPGAALVPIVMGSQSWTECAELGEALIRCCDTARTLFVASSDLSHFHAYDEAVRLDAVFCALLETLDARALHDGVTSGRCEACGAGPVVATLLATESLSGRRERVLARFNSGDVTGERRSVVGYAAAAMTGGGAVS